MGSSAALLSFETTSSPGGRIGGFEIRRAKNHGLHVSRFALLGLHPHPTMHPSGHHVTPEAQPALGVPTNPPNRGLDHDFQLPVAGL